jgi:predicted XRE-type DNA-binding protein
MLSGGDPVPALKRQLAAEIRALVGMFPSDVGARVFAVDQPRMANILNDRLKRFSLQRLVRLLAHVDRRVKLEVLNEGEPILRIFHFRNPRPLLRGPSSRPWRGSGNGRAGDPSRDSR